MKQSKAITSKSKQHVPLFIAATVVISVFAVLFTFYSKRLVTVGIQEGQKQSYYSASIATTAAVAANNGVIELKAGSVTQASSIPGVYEVDKGTKAVCVPIAVKNLSGSEQAFIPLEEISIIDSNGKSYPIQGVLTCAPGVGGPMQVGEVLEGQLGFLLPDASDTYSLHYTPLQTNTKSVIVNGL